MMENYRKYIEKVLNREIIKSLISYIEIEKYESIKRNRNSFYDGESVAVGCTALINIGSNEANINEKKLSEIEKLCEIFKEKEFFFISDWIKENGIDGVSLRYNSDIVWDKFSNNERHFENYFNSNLPGNWWIGENWCRYISESMSDSYSKYYGRVIDIPHELVITKKSHFDKILKVYQNYGTIEPILMHRDFFEKIFESEFSYLLSENIYVTSNSIDYINKQL